MPIDVLCFQFFAMRNRLLPRCLAAGRAAAPRCRHRRVCGIACEPERPAAKDVSGGERAAVFFQGCKPYGRRGYQCRRR